VFALLSEEELKDVTRKLLKEFSDRCKLSDIEVEFSEEVIEKITEMGTDSLYGARPLRRAITTYVEDVFARKFYEGDIVKGAKVYCQWEDEGIKLNIT
jgi:ATP-dependent Clp protease ATP-binding subunit ClpC